MKVALHLFASIREAVGAREVCLELDEGATLLDLKRRLATEYPKLEQMLERVAATRELLQRRTILMAAPCSAIRCERSMGSSTRIPQVHHMTSSKEKPTSTLCAA